MIARIVLLALAFGVATEAAAGPEIPEPETALVLPGGGLGADGAYHIGLKLMLPEGWHSYWRNPGDSGVPPVFDAGTSDNLADLRPDFPAPERFFDGFGTSIVYHDEVVFPLAVTPAEPDRPVTLKLAFGYGFCKEICIPARAEFEAVLKPDDAADPAAAAMLATAVAKVPVPEGKGGPGAPHLVAIEPAGEGAVDLRVEAKGGAEAVDIFAEGPKGWYLSPPERRTVTGDTAVFRLSLDGKPKKAAASGTSLRLTLVGPGGAVEALRRLP